MATRAGKTKVLSLLIAWSFFHRLYEPDSTLARNFLVIAPNIIVLDRLRADFDGLRIFFNDPVLPANGHDGRNWRDDLQLTLHIGRAGNGIDDWEHPVYGDSMNIRITLDSAGRVVIPKGLREELHLQPGDELDLEASDEQITLRPVRETPPLSKERGVWVFRTGHPLPASATDDVLQRSRRDRDRENLGPGK